MRSFSYARRPKLEIRSLVECCISSILTRLNSATVSGYPWPELDFRPVFPPIRGWTHNTPYPAALYPYYCPGSSGATYPIVTVSVLVRPAELITITTNW